jgi:hypothetical protein
MKKQKAEITKMTSAEIFRKCLKEGVFHVLNDDLDDKRHHFVLIYQGVIKK